MRVGMCINMSMRDCTLVHMHTCMHECMHAHMCRWMTSPVDAELAASAVLGRVPANWRPLLLLDTGILCHNCLVLACLQVR